MGALTRPRRRCSLTPPLAIGFEVGEEPPCSSPPFLGRSERGAHVVRTRQRPDEVAGDATVRIMAQRELFS